MTEVAARALEVCDCQMIQWSVDPQPSELHTSSQVLGFNSVYDGVVGTLAFGFAVNAPGESSLVRVKFGGTAPGAGEVHLACPSDCFPRSTSDGYVAIQAAASVQDRGRASKDLLPEWQPLSQYWSEGRRSGCACRVQGCPIRFSAGEVGGRRFLRMTPEPASWDLW